MRIVTIGGYGFTEAGFIGALRKAGVDTFVDVRQRRGMRGAKYAFLNSTRLQNLLASAGIKYLHALELAPTASVRNAQKEVDRASGVAKRDRLQLSSAFTEEYRSKVLARFDADRLVGEINGTNGVALFCVEEHPAACHRSLAAEHLFRQFGGDHPVEHLRA